MGRRFTLVPAPSGFDADALAFFSATGITDSTIKSAINDLVLSLKSFGLWSKMHAIYPMVGGSATTHKYNLKDPRDLDAAFRITFAGGWSHSSNGALPNGVNAYGDTHLVPTTEIANVNDGHLSYYSRTNNSGINQIEIGSIDVAATSAFDLVIKFGGGNLAGACINMSDGNVFTNSNPSTGLYLASQNNTANVRKMFRNGSSIQTQTVSQNVQANYSVYIGSRNGMVESSGLIFPSNRECAFASIGNGLSDTEAANMYTVVQAFQTYLSRNV
jgi:hypothetical protein